MGKAAFEPFSTIITPEFWSRLSRKKLEELKLKDDFISVWGYFELGRHGTESAPTFHLTEDGLAAPEESSLGKIRVDGKIKLFNILEEFRDFDKAAFLRSLETKIFDMDYTFYVFSFADLKKHRFYYHVLHPVPFYKDHLIDFTSFNTSALSHEDRMEFLSNSHGPMSFQDDDGSLVIFDPCSREGVLGWPSRLVLAKLPAGNHTLKIIRMNTITNVIVQIADKDGLSLQITGWETNEHGHLLPRMTDLSPLMDPKQLAREAADLNLRLIKWRLIPDLDLSIFARQRILLLGAGTLGCNVARALLGWGVRNFTFVDYGQVSYSNPSRQSLFTHEDCHKGKAEIAAFRLRQIDPNVEAKGVSLAIPMPGHRIQNETETFSAISNIWDLIRENDVIFQLTDSRESRWLSSLLGRLEEKMVITVALGFDSFVVMRHGTPGNRLGCYFCSDGQALQDTLTQRTLDQQCTVTRAGVSLMASAVGVELMASLLQHPSGIDAEATAPSQPTDLYPPGSSILGAVPHQIRGYIGHFQNLLLTGEYCDTCTACGEGVIQGVRSEGASFVLKCLQDPDFSLRVAEDAAVKNLSRTSSSSGTRVLRRSLRCDDIFETASAGSGNEDFCLI